MTNAKRKGNAGEVFQVSAGGAQYSERDCVGGDRGQSFVGIENIPEKLVF